MELSQQQREAVSQWIASGESLAVVQRRLRDEFSLSMTYMEVRFLVDDLGLELKTPEKPKPAAPAVDALAGQPPVDPLAAPGADAPAAGDEEFAADLADELAKPDAPGALKVEVDRIMRPGTVVSGSVTFSDGKSATWALDQMGRLMLDAGKTGYKPSQGDIAAFQQELSVQLQRHGY
ncbi:MAG TPA: hypothetical protein VMM36_01280 [Opitutaceae bacterium]|nr:hypothetical protein [Opitutaceae bacterium]